jgi:hypothetical protein
VRQETSFEAIKEQLVTMQSVGLFKSLVPLGKYLLAPPRSTLPELHKTLGAIFAPSESDSTVLKLYTVNAAYSGCLLSWIFRLLKIATTQFRPDYR